MLRQLSVLALLGGAMVVASANPAPAADRVVLVGCDLLTQPGPTALYLQAGGASGSGIAIGGRDGDVRGRNCAEVLAEVAASGLNFREFRIIGRNSTEGVWFWKVR